MRGDDRCGCIHLTLNPANAFTVTLGKLREGLLIPDIFLPQLLTQRLFVFFTNKLPFARQTFESLPPLNFTLLFDPA